MRTDTRDGVIETVLPRQTLLYRSNAFKSKLIAANVTQMVIVLATQPSFYESLLNRCLVAAEYANVKPLIVLNKCDLECADALQKVAIYQALSIPVVRLSAKQDIAPLREHLENHCSIMVGQSGMGKSTIINALLPNENVRTQEVSTVLDSGKHTTTAARLYHLDATSSLIDSPGLQEFGLFHLSKSELAHAFVEFKPFLGKCKYNNCQHSHEPDCAILNAFKMGKIAATRLKHYQEIALELA